jgi:DNA-binding winged helix-turn-helix (wHTH) protein
MERTAYSYRFGSAEFDEARFELRVSGLPVEVERRALEVLAYLLRHAGEVVTKDELLREVWAGRITVDKVLANAINKLRRALGERNAEHISTQARVGYRLDGQVTRSAVGRQLGSALSLAAGQPVPGRDNFLLRRQLGNHRGSEVWLAEHAKTREQRVYKFGVDSDRLRALKREATLSRVLRESLAERHHFVALIDWNFESAPYFLECEYGGQNLLEWSDTGLAALSQAQRLALFLQIADAVAAAHAVGVLHKDLKPANVLIQPSTDGAQIRLTDFGSGRLLDPDQLELLGISRMGMTVNDSIGADSSSGTPLYIAPELFTGQTPTVQSDVFALGILLYQLLSGRMNQPMVPGWEADIDDPLLCEDLARATDGKPERRLSSVAEFAARLRALDTRRAQAEADAHTQAQAQAAAAALARGRARRPFVLALIAALALGLSLAVVLQQSAQRARAAAETELARATAINRFLNEDLISRANPLVLARGADAPLKDVLLASRERISARFADQPQTEATLRSSLAGLFAALDLWSEGEAEATRALQLFSAELGADSIEAQRARALRVHLLSRLSRFDEAEAELAQLETAASRTSDDASRHARAKAAASFHFTRSAFADAVPQLQTALATLDAVEPSNQALRDSLRIDLVVALGLSGEYAQAQGEAEALIAEARGRREDSALPIALTQLAVARSHSYLGDHARAEALLLEAQPVIIERLGEEHSRHLGLINELMAVAFRQNDWGKALPYAEQVERRLRERFGAEHNMSLVSRGNLGRVLFETGRDADAVIHLRATQNALAASLGAQAPQAQDLAFVLAGAELELGQLDAAETLINSLDPTALENGRSTGQWPASIDVLRGLLLSKRGDSAGAVELLQRSLPKVATEPSAKHSRLFRQAQATLAGLEGAQR